MELTCNYIEFSSVNHQVRGPSVIGDHQEVLDDMKIDLDLGQSVQIITKPPSCRATILKGGQLVTTNTTPDWLTEQYTLPTKDPHTKAVITVYRTYRLKNS